MTGYKPADLARCSMCATICDVNQMHPLAAEGLGFFRECPSCHPCSDVLRVTAAEVGTDVTVSGEPPIVAGPYTTEPFVCPHGITYWIEPTGEQITRWVEEGTS